MDDEFEAEERRRLGTAEQEIDRILSVLETVEVSAAEALAREVLDPVPALDVLVKAARLRLDLVTHATKENTDG